MSNSWFRMYAEFRSDPKVQLLSEAMQRRYVMLLCLQCDETLQKLSEEEICFALKITKSKLSETFSQLFKKNLIVVENGKVYITNWNKRQYISDNSTDRVKRYREKMTNETLQKRLCNGNETPPETDTETDTDIEKESKEKEATLTPEKIMESNSQVVDITNKKKYHEFVYLSDTEYEWLLKEYWKELVDRMILELNNHIGSKNAFYPNHFYTVRTWCYRRVMEGEKRPHDSKPDDRKYTTERS